MFEIKKKTILSENIYEFVIHAPKVAAVCLPGQFLMLVAEENGERVPFTICDFNREQGTVTIMVQCVGYTTFRLSQFREGDCFSVVVGPLGKPTDLSRFERILLVSGGIGVSVTYPQAKLLYGKKHVSAVMGARTAELLHYTAEMTRVVEKLYLMTDDGSCGEKGFVTDAVDRLLQTESFDAVFAVGPLRMMQAVAAVTKRYGVKTIVSLNPIMVDGTGMCGCCRVTVNGKVKYACVDGPEFDGHAVDFEELLVRNSYYRNEERDHLCRLEKMAAELK